jgi:hypothetical protein
MLSRHFAGGKEENHERIQRRYWIPDGDLERVLADYETELNCGCISTLTFQKRFISLCKKSCNSKC